MNLVELATFVRRQVDADTDDAPLDNLEIYARAAYNDIVRRRNNWPHKYVETTLVTNPGQRDYSLQELGAGNFETVTGVVSDKLGNLTIFPRHDMVAAFGFVNPNKAIPQFVSVGPQFISFYPTPISSLEYRVLGYAKFVEWPSDGSSPDLPSDFDYPIAWAMCRDYYLSQEEPDMAVMYDRRYENDVARLVGRLGQSFGSYASPTYFTGIPPRSAKLRRRGG
jgi:hypothetical protein